MLIIKKFVLCLTMFVALTCAPAVMLSPNNQRADAQLSSAQFDDNPTHDANSLLFNASNIYKSNSIVVGPYTRNLAIIIPDSIGTDRSADISWPTFLPANATISKGARVIWFNSDVNVTHSIIVKNALSGESIFNSTSVPYQNATEFRFADEGLYNFTDPKLSNITGYVNVTSTPLASTDENRTDTVGLFVVPAEGKVTFDQHIHRLGFSPLWTYAFTNPSTGVNGTVEEETTQSNATKILYVWSQESSGLKTTVDRIANKARILEGIIYPHDMVKQ